MSPALTVSRGEDCGVRWQDNEADFRGRFVSFPLIAQTACTFGLAARSDIGLLLYP